MLVWVVQILNVAGLSFNNQYEAEQISAIQQDTGVYGSALQEACCFFVQLVVFPQLLHLF